MHSASFFWNVGVSYFDCFLSLLQVKAPDSQVNVSCFLILGFLFCGEIPSGVLPELQLPVEHLTERGI